MKQLVMIAVLVVATGVRADDRGKAREAYRVGRQHYALREYKEALVAFQEAYRNYEDPSFLFNIAQCERQLDHRAEAIRAYRMYLVNAPDTANRDDVRQIISRLEHELEADRAAAQAAKAQAATPIPPPPAVSTAVIAPPHALIATTAAPPHAEKPAYKKWWVWTLVGVAVAGGAAAGLAVGLTRNNGSSPTASTTFGTASPF